jgi:hypothetical protein
MLWRATKCLVQATLAHTFLALHTLPLRIGCLLRSLPPEAGKLDRAHRRSVSSRDARRGSNADSERGESGKMGAMGWGKKVKARMSQLKTRIKPESFSSPFQGRGDNAVADSKVFPSEVFNKSPNPVK